MRSQYYSSQLSVPLTAFFFLVAYPYTAERDERDVKVHDKQKSEYSIASDGALSMDTGEKSVHGTDDAVQDSWSSGMLNPDKCKHNMDLQLERGTRSIIRDALDKEKVSKWHIANYIVDHMDAEHPVINKHWTASVGESYDVVMYRSKWMDCTLSDGLMIKVWKTSS